MKKLILVAFILSVSISTYAQDKLSSSNSRALSAYQRSNIALNQKLYNTAIKDLEEALRHDPNFLEARFRLADVFKEQKSYRKALEEYQEVQSRNSTFSKHFPYVMGECYFNLHVYDSALVLFESYVNVPDLSENRKKDLARYLSNSKFSVEAINKKVPYEPVNMGPNINTVHQEYLPTVTADDNTLIFTRRISGEDFYTSTKENNEWSKAVSLSNIINTSGNEGAQCISPDGQYVFFAGCQRKDGLGACDIYYSKLTGNEWSTPVNLGPPINTSYWESHPSISADGKHLYFVSNRKGGYGSTDIYRSNYLGNGKWGTPVNLGPSVNTAGEEYFPFIHSDNKTLYFSSNGWPGFGDKDIFYAKKKDDGGWEKPVNIGYPINTSQEESSLFISNDGKKAFFASNNLKGEGGMDLYSFDLYEEARPSIVTYVKGTVVDKNTKVKLQSQVEIIDISNGDTVSQTSSNASSGQFLASLPAGKTYALNVNREGYLFYSDNFSLQNKRSIEPFKLTVELEPIEVGAKIALKNIFFETNSFKLKNESRYELLKLNQFMKQNNNVRLEISGHTDNVGNEQANQLLSSNRAKAVYDYLIKNGIDAKRLTYKGYGKTQPVDVNTTEQGRANNRRTEIKIVGNE